MTCRDMTFISSGIIEFYSAYFTFEKTVFHYFCVSSTSLLSSSRLLTIIDHPSTLFFLPLISFYLSLYFFFGSILAGLYFYLSYSFVYISKIIRMIFITFSFFYLTVFNWLWSFLKNMFKIVSTLAYRC